MIAYLSQNADKRIFDAFRQEGFDAVPLAPFSALSHPVDTHADMLLCDVGDTVFVHEDYQLELNGFKKKEHLENFQLLKSPSGSSKRTISQSY